jgi:hypothetical protein
MTVFKISKPAKEHFEIVAIVRISVQKPKISLDMLKINVEIEKLATTYSSRYMTELAEAYLL